MGVSETFEPENRHIFAVPANRRPERRDKMKKSKNRANENKDKEEYLNLRLPREEKWRLKRMAEKSNLNLSEYVRVRLFGSDGKQRGPGVVCQCAVLCQDIFNVVQEKYSCEDNSLLEEKVEELWNLLS